MGADARKTYVDSTSLTPVISILENKKGEIVTMTMIMMGLGMVVMAAVFSGILNVYKLKKSESLTLQQQDTIKQIDNLLTLPTICGSLFNGQNISSSVSNPNNASFATNMTAGTTVLLNGQTVNLNAGTEVAPGLILGGMKYLQNSNVSTTVDVGGTARNGHDGTLTLSFSKKDTNNFFSTYKDVSFKIQMATDGAGDIFSCATLGEEGQACTSLNGIWRPLAPVGLRCQIRNTCLTGGTYVNAPENEGGFRNSLAGNTFGCPAGYEARRKGNVAFPYNTGKYDVKNRLYDVFECISCTDNTGVRVSPASSPSPTSVDKSFDEAADAADSWMNQNKGFYGL